MTSSIIFFEIISKFIFFYYKKNMFETKNIAELTGLTIGMYFAKWNFLFLWYNAKS